MINNNTKIGFDEQKRPIVAYHKYDSAARPQLYNARLRKRAMVSHQTSQWAYRWGIRRQRYAGVRNRSGRGQASAKRDLHGGVLPRPQYGGWGAFRLDPVTLAPAATIDPPLPYPKALDTPGVGRPPGWSFDGPPMRAEAPTRPSLHAEVGNLGIESRHAPAPPIPPPTRLRLIRHSPAALTQPD